MKTIIALLALLISLAGPAVAATPSVAENADTQPAEARPVPWPMISGPEGNYRPLPADGFAYVDHPGQIRKLWESEYNHFGYVKVGSAREGRILGKIAEKRAGWDSHPGSAATPIVAQGLVFGVSFRPAGPDDDLRDEKRAKGVIRGRESKAQSMAHLDPLDPAVKKHFLATVRRQAEDIVFALDARTGKLVWEQAEPGGLNLYAGKRDVWGVSPAWLDGRVFALGTTGRLRAYDAKTGKILWEIEHDTLPGGHTRWKRTFELDLIAVDGRLIVPTGSSVLGVDPQTGKVLWQASLERGRLQNRFANPGIWRHEGKAYLVYAGLSEGRKPALSLVDPTDGRIVWTRPIGPHTDSVTVVGDIAFVAVEDQEIEYEKHGERETVTCGVRGGLRLSLEGAELLWTLSRGDAKYTHSPGADKGVRRKASAGADNCILYFPTGQLHEPRHIFRIDAATGKILAEQPQQPDHWPKGPYAYQIGDKVLHLLNGAAGPGGFDALLRDAATLDPIGDKIDWGDLPVTTAYEVFIEHPIVDGRVFLRTERGTLACYDLRKPAE